MSANKSLKQDWIPEIMYEDTSSGGASTFPFIQVPQTKNMPGYLCIFEYKDTGEFEPGLKGEEIPIVDQIPHQFVDLNVLKERLSPELYDEVRVAVGLMPLKQASKLGQEKLDKIMANVEKIKQELLVKQEQENKKEKK